VGKIMQRRYSLKETEKTQKVYEGNNPDSLAAWIYKDISLTDNGRIFLESEDKSRKVDWAQNKSNENIFF
jgi:hypothetical protein